MSRKLKEVFRGKAVNRAHAIVSVEVFQESGRAPERDSAASQSERLRIALKSKTKSDRYNRLLEHVADQWRRGPGIRA